MKSYNKKIKLFSSFLLSLFSILGFSQAAFHDTKGNIEVTGAGQLNYNLSIEVPPGIKSVSPKISLVYTSGSGNGVAGYGWNISGITSISRLGKTIENDGELRGVQLDESDYYSFNGQRLILKSGEYGKDGAEYVTEKYSNVKIKSLGAISGQSWKGPEYWEINFEDGSQAWYGGTTTGTNQARTPIEYNIVKWKDAQGNYISYTYSQLPSKNVAVISTISWGGNEVLNTPAINQITFNYTSRVLAEQNYINGVSLIQDRILDNIIVTTNNKPYKKYIIEYTKNGTNYDLVNKITEYNSSGIAANPVIFSYPNLVSSEIDYTGVLPTNSDSFDNIRLTGDFNGDSYVDFIMNNGTIKLGAFNDAYQEISTGKTFSIDAKVVATLLDEQGQIYNGNGIVQFEEGKVVGYIFRNNTFVKVFEKLVYDTSNCNYQSNGAGCTTSVVLNEGDFNGDGISDVFVTLKQRLCQFVPDPNCVPPDSKDTAKNPDPCTVLQCTNYDIGNFIVDLKNKNNLVSTYTLDQGLNESSYGDQKYLDIDGDGKVDIINVSNSAYTVFEFIKAATGQYIKKIRFTGNLAETKASEFPVLFGDFNGDGNLDFTIPVTDNQDADNWRLYMGTEKGFQNTLKSNFLKYRKPAQVSPLALIDHYFYSVSDINKDGKSDIVFIYSKNKVVSVGSSGNALWRSLQYEVKTMQANGGVDFIPGFSTTSPSYTVGGAEYGLFQPLTSIIKSNNNYYDIFIFKATRVHKYKTQTSLAELSRISSINQGDVITSVEYKELNPTTNPYFYNKTKKEIYPYFSLERADRSYAVSQLIQAGKKQDFRYRGMTGQLIGKGVIGYHQSARSSWYADGINSTKIWSGVEIDPLKDGLPAKQWSIRTNDESKIFPTNLSVNNTELLSFSSTAYQQDYLLNGVLTTTPISSTDKPKVVTVILPKTTVNKNFLKGIVISSSTTYGDYYLPSQSVSNTNSGYGTVTSNFVYVHNPSGVGSNYYIGRPKTKTDIVKAYGDTKSGKEEYVFQDNLLKTLKTWNRDNTGYLLETYGYDGFGNITSKVITNSIDSGTQSTTTKYESSGRFIEKSTDNLGLVTSYIYNDNGQITSQTDPWGNILTNTYDNWGKLLTSNTNLQGTTSYVYERDNNSNITIIQNDSDGSISKKFVNKLGQEYKITTKAFGQGQYISKETQYDALGRKIKESEPYFEGQNASGWNTITYDDSVFPAKITATSFNGKKIETSISGNITTVKELNGYARITSKTSDALGNVVSSTDKGGTIQFNYNAAGEQIKAQYAENIVTTKYDLWGRKSEFNDPSNGTYKYEYDGLGKTKKVISPKGTKEYTYNTKGLLSSQKEISTSDVGLSTNKTISFLYDTKGKLTSKSGTSNGQGYSLSFSYSPQGRLISSSENSNGKNFIQKNITYDDKGRVNWYDKELHSSGMITKVRIENVYSPWNGEMYQVKNKMDGKVLWELGETNAKDQVLIAKLGAANINNTYDTNGFLKTTNHSTTLKPGILQISYSFDAIKNELKTRTTGGDFNIVESFDYDDNNRLINWTDPVTGIKPTNNRNTYDNKGRILSNDQVGAIKFENTAKVYQPTGMTLNAAGTQNYNNDLIQSISYNENNDPVFIDGEKGDVAFQYGLTAMRQKMTYGGNFSQDTDGKFTRSYSENGNFEVTKDNISGKEKHIIYIGGTPYESNIIYIKDFDEAGGSFKFLHKDYLGSILAISDEAGNKLEQRHFDAWGSLTHLKIGNAATLTDMNIKQYLSQKNLLLDRGYTGHEYLSEVGIIHMNGRLYDPLLRRFLNADENIQDPYNTQNYNKYGYVMNNPLMFNDPSGEYWEAGFFLAWIAPIIWGAVVGTIISAGFYGLQALMNNSWSWGGFAKSILLGAVTGAVSAGAGLIFSPSGFWGSIATGAISGSASGGVVSLINGTNFLEGLAKGAVIGGAVAGIMNGITWAVNKYCNSYEYSINEMVATDSNTVDGATDADFSIDTVMKVDKARYNGQFIRGSYKLVDSSSDLSNNLRNNGYSYDNNTDLIINGNKQQVMGVTEKVTHNNKVVWQRIYLPKGTFISLEQLDLTMGHEIFHSILNNAGLYDQIGGSLNAKDSVHEYFISRWEEQYVKFRGWQKLNLQIGGFNSAVVGDNTLDALRNKIKPIFNNYLKSTLK
ncbi:FG-GAP-like repeat-containing protein [Chryseobacterium daecheongense]|nr:FG-GAP-like repeat-containing protein [Chryseobacterium daecheongense]